MEIWEVVGFRPVNFTDQKTGNNVTGTTLFVERPAENNQVTGMECQKLFVPSSIRYDAAVGDTVQITFNRYGKISSVQII